MRNLEVGCVKMGCGEVIVAKFRTGDIVACVGYETNLRTVVNRKEFIDSVGGLPIFSDDQITLCITPEGAYTWDFSDRYMMVKPAKEILFKEEMT